MEAAHLPWRRLGDLLLSDRLIGEEQLREAFEEQRISGHRLGEIVVARGWLTPIQLAKALAQQWGLEYVDLHEDELDPEAASLLPASLARRYHALPVRVDEHGVVIVAVADPTNVVASDDLRLALGTSVRFVVVEHADLERAIKQVHRTELDYETSFIEELGDDEDDENFERLDLADTMNTVPAVRAVNAALGQAIEDGASDIHFEPQEEELHVRARIDGVMRDVATIPRPLQLGVSTRLKIMGGLDIAERRAPQDGRIHVKAGGQPVDLRVAVLPTTHGEQIVLRVLHRASGRLELEDLEMAPETQGLIERAIRQPYGAIIACGPTGSGKTTTLYTALHELNDPGRVLMTIEDPVEYQIPGVAQIEVRPKAGLTFAKGLRTILRSDPDVLLVGEVRDEETARIAMQAAMTGHLVLTTLHAHSAPSAIARLKDMGIEPGILATSLNCLIAQRLARRLCTDCREPYAATPEERAQMGLQDWKDQIVLYRAGGCGRCGRTGYRGRVALYEVLPIEGRVRALLEASTEEIFHAAIQEGMKTLRQDGLRLCFTGVSSLEEIQRVTGDRVI